MEWARAFEDIDTDCSGEITKDELYAYMRKNNYEEGFVQRWLRLFDKNHDGKITLDEFTDTLGLKPREEYLQKVEVYRQNTLLKNRWGDVRVIQVADNMKPEIRDRLMTLADESQKLYTKEVDIARYMKTKLDVEFGQHWHIVVCRLNYAAFVSHEAGYLLQFWMRRFCFLIWKTPSY